MQKLKLGLAVSVIILATLLSYSVLSPIFLNSPIDATSHKYGLSYNVYATITFSQHGKIVYSYSGLDPLTNLGLNLTFAKLTGSSSYNLTTYNMNTTYVSLGNYTTAMNGATTSLTGEFIRVVGTIHAQVYNGFNITGVFSSTSSPILTGSNSSNCMGLEYGGTGFQADLFGYTTFSLVTGIDNTFTITAEIQVQGTTS